MCSRPGRTANPASPAPAPNNSFLAAFCGTAFSFVRCWAAFPPPLCLSLGRAADFFAHFSGYFPFFSPAHALFLTPYALLFYNDKKACRLHPAAHFQNLQALFPFGVPKSVRAQILRVPSPARRLFARACARLPAVLRQNQRGNFFENDRC